jgi:hypothetical protein
MDKQFLTTGLLNLMLLVNIDNDIILCMISSPMYLTA